MLPEKRKQLLIIAISIVIVILIIYAMYSLAAYMKNRKEKYEPKVVDNTYPSIYQYYGFRIDEDNNYQLIGLNDAFEETKVGLRSFYYVDNLYYLNKHLVIYSDAINQINYNSEKDEFFFYELDSFYSNKVNVLINNNYYIYIEENNLSFKNKESEEKIEITNELVDETVLCNNSLVFYKTNSGIYEYNLENRANKIVMLPNESNKMEILDLADEYLIFLNEDDYYAYRFEDSKLINLSENINTTFKYVGSIDAYFLYEITNEENENIVMKYALNVNSSYKTGYNIGNLSIIDSFAINDDLLYAELSENEKIKYVIMDLENEKIIKELENHYKNLIEVGK